MPKIADLINPGLRSPTGPVVCPPLEFAKATVRPCGRAEYPVAYSDAAWGTRQIVLYSSTTANIAKVIYSCSRDGNTPVYSLFDRFAFAPERSLIARPLGV
ncbi:hypothetical protein [Methyloversatilis sp. XJ19-49]|uniref:hypothetical protein n=1 Tax=Methyloversatilis sp. XJ19-49 TaxID=2963429 RepID=UPI00211CC22B|nr:hypothetical protein [Methyloversatilis sp. XJ19-49]MCQ9380164.1 hypothetical protein [Methyloversatilis sp. XJ19-49]